MNTTPTEAPKVQRIYFHRVGSPHMEDTLDIPLGDDPKRHVAEALIHRVLIEPARRGAPTEAPSTVRDAAQALIASANTAQAKSFHEPVYALVPIGKFEALRAALAAPTVPAAEAPSPQKYDDTLLPFVALMRSELHANSRKGDRPGWLTMSREVGLLEIYWHTAKLSAAVKNNDAALIREHCADVANMAMMLLDVCGGLATTPTDPSSDTPRPAAEGETPREANNPITALSIELLVAAGHVSREKADEAYEIACRVCRDEAERQGKGEMFARLSINAAFASPPPEAQAPSAAVAWRYNSPDYPRWQYSESRPTWSKEWPAPDGVVIQPLYATPPVSEQDKRDAARYRWLEEHTVATGLSPWMGGHQFLSSAIDAALKGEAP